MARKAEWVALAVVVLSFALAVYFYPIMPDRMASHWNAQGLVDGYMDTFWGLFLMPIISFLLLGLFLLIPRIDPLKENIKIFRKYFDMFVVLMMVFLLYLFLLTIFWNLGSRFDFVLVIVPAFVALFYYVGILTEHAKRNWFIGIRTPWTLSSDKVWAKTHKLGGKLFKLSALVAAIGLFFEDYALWFVIAPVLLVVAYTIAYSYFEFQREKKVKKRKRK